MRTKIAKGLLIASLIGFWLTFPAWLLGWIDEKAMLGLTLALSWAALWYAAFGDLMIADEQENKK